MSNLNSNAKAGLPGGVDPDQDPGRLPLRLEPAALALLLRPASSLFLLLLGSHVSCLPSQDFQL